MRGSKILLVGPHWPEPDKSAASIRTLGLIQALLAAGAQLSFCSDARFGAGSARLQELGVDCQRLAPNDAAFDAYVAAFAPSMAIFDRFTTEEKFGWRVRAAAPDCLRVLDTIDLHWLRAAREEATALGRSFTATPAELLALGGATAWREVAAIYRSDLALLVSDAEVALLVDLCGVPPAQLHLCRLCYAPSPVPPLPFNERVGFGLIGSFRHPPNTDAVLWLQREVWPLIRRALPAATVAIWGADALPKHLAWSRPDLGFVVKGFLAAPESELRHWRVNLAPLRFGAGLKGKVAEGWSFGTPVATTPIGAEGMHGGAAFGGLIAADAAGLAAAAVQLYTDAEAWTTAAAAGTALLTSLYSPAATLAPLVTRLRELLATGRAERPRNFTGAMLWQQGLRSTEYFSRWLALKNQRPAGPQ